MNGMAAKNDGLQPALDNIDIKDLDNIDIKKRTLESGDIKGLRVLYGS